MSRLPDSFLARPVAHRGLHDRARGVVENSLAAFRAAREAGYAVELDVQISADGRAMVFHDATLDRLTAETGPTRARTAQELAAIRLTDSEETIPTLEQALAAIGPETPVIVEVKRQADEIGVGPLEEAALPALDGHRGPLAVMSFDPRSALWFRNHAPHLPRGIVAKDFTSQRMPEGDAPFLTDDQRSDLAALAWFDAAEADFVSYGWIDLPHHPAPQALRARGVPVLCWTVRGPEQEAEARRHADNVTFEGYLPEIAPAPQAAH
jgi:glycerophosphoryl diester phosphodiesterase